MAIASQLLKHKGRVIHSVPPDAPVLEAIRLMAEHGVGALLVMQAEQLIGVVSERDYARKVARPAGVMPEVPRIKRPGPPAVVLLRTDEGLAATGISRSELYRRLRSGRFPAPVRLGAATYFQLSGMPNSL